MSAMPGISTKSTGVVLAYVLSRTLLYNMGPDVLTMPPLLLLKHFEENIWERSLWVCVTESPSASRYGDDMMSFINGLLRGVEHPTPEASLFLQAFPRVMTGGLLEGVRILFLA